MSEIRGIGIVADDLTGGSAIGGEFATTARPVSVVRWSDAASPPIPMGPVIIETGSRYLDIATSSARVRSAIRELKAHDYSIVMKKIDSTLKGNVGSELAAFCAESEGTVVIAPSCPAVGLHLVGGRQYTPAGPGQDVAQLLTGVLDAPPGLLTLETVRAGVDAVRRAVAAMSHPVVLADGETQADLDIVAAGARAEGVRFFGGTYGLGAALARTEGDVAATRTTAMPLAERMLVIVGSANPRTLRQVDHLVGQGAAEVQINVEALLAGAANLEAERVRLLLLRDLAPVVVVHTDAAATSELVRERGRESGWTEHDLAAALSAPLTAAVRAMPDAGVFFVGGETTGATFDELGWNTLSVVGELDDAVPITLTRQATHPFIVLKPGAFGREDVFSRAARSLLG